MGRIIIHTIQNEKKYRATKRSSRSEVLSIFLRALLLAGIQAPQGFYERLWTPLITLWYLIWQGLQSDRTLEKDLTDARRGGADGLCAPGKRLSKGLSSKATAGYSKARQRLPLDWVRRCFEQLATGLLSLASEPGLDLPVQLLDGSTKRLRPQRDIPQSFPPHRTRCKHPYWCIARVVVSFCASTGLATGARIASIHCSEQALAVQLILQAAKRLLYIGDRNFGVWRVVRATVQSGGQSLVRLTKVRARRLLGQKRLPGLLDRLVVWSPSAHDQLDLARLSLLST